MTFDEFYGEVLNYLANKRDYNFSKEFQFILKEIPMPWHTVMDDESFQLIINPNWRFGFKK